MAKERYYVAQRYSSLETTYDTLDDARQEARRQLNNNPGEEVLILKYVEAYKAEVTISQVQDTDDSESSDDADTADDTPAE
ncbi:hypothetical protein [Carnimonas bestiolae]|uniref:hypothetical protein n=1 Tax=Carnimonas bestiolae TaxID=3402172 RepID=UPI003EDBD290